MSFAVYTSCALNYLPKARALAESLREHHPEIRLTLCLNDLLPDWLDPAREPFHQIWTPRDLGYNRGWIFEHNVMELCTAVKGRALQRLLDEEDVEVIAYLDPDVFLFHRMDPVLDYLGSDSIGLVPHILSPEETDIGVRLTEMSVTEHGIYNLGHLFIRRDPRGRAFADWWAARLDKYCFDDRERGLFTDQRWVDLAPAIFEGVRILRQPNLDVASWNLFERHLAHLPAASRKDTPAFSVNDMPLITYHFSGTGPTGTHRRMRDIFDPGNAATAEIERLYETSIARHGQLELERHSSGFDVFDNGEPITAELRKLYRRHGDLQRAFPDPYAVRSGKLSFLEWVRQHRPGLVGGYRIAEDRLERAFLDLFDADYYLAAYPDAADAIADGQFVSALDHYCRIGSRQFMDPNEYFVSAYYYDQAHHHDGYRLRDRPESMESTLLWHYLAVGLPNRIEPIEFFDSQWYLAQNPDIGDALRTGQISSPLGHFLRNGSAEGRNPGPAFSGKRYLSESPYAQQIAKEPETRGAFGAFVALAASWAEPLSEPASPARQIIFVGGPGRSGTSFIADRLGRHPQICSFPNSELKLFTEKNGLIDLHHALVETYSPNRATVALDQFRKFYIALVDGRFGQEALTAHAPRPEWIAILDAFVAALTKNGQAGLATSAAFHQSARILLWRIAALAARAAPKAETPGVFLEKTPHALLTPNFLTNLAPGCRLLHVMRDPRSIAFSLKSMSWGPETLSECCAWVANYCEAWLHAQSRAAASGHEITRVHIEEVALASEQASEKISSALKLEPIDSLFHNADIQTLNGWRERCSEREFSTLNAGLRGWCRHFGYASNEVGTLSQRCEDHAA